MFSSHRSSIRKITIISVSAIKESSPSPVCRLIQLLSVTSEGLVNKWKHGTPGNASVICCCCWGPEFESCLWSVWGNFFSATVIWTI